MNARRKPPELKSHQKSLFDIAPWPDHMRALPNDFARSSLFTARNKRVPRAALQSHPIYHLSEGVQITYTGIELRAEDDELVWLQILEYSKRFALGESFYFSFYELCNDIGWHVNKTYYEKCEECLNRLKATSINISSERLGRIKARSLINRFDIVEKNSRARLCVAVIDQEISRLFAGNYYSKFIWDRYRDLSPIARRLFDYFSSHKEPFPLRLENFKAMCDSQTAEPRKWRQQVGNACAELQEIGLVDRAWVANDLAFCERRELSPAMVIRG